MTVCLWAFILWTYFGGGALDAAQSVFQPVLSLHSPVFALLHCTYVEVGDLITSDLSHLCSSAARRRHCTILHNSTASGDFHGMP